MTEIKKMSESYAVAICNNLDENADQLTAQEIDKAIDIVVNQANQYVPRKVFITICKYLMRRIESNG